ncbi:hypothetical protein AKJ44_01245 [candidate division MSBL1 archaeon SCGC-AAA261F17]|uniref:Uncharacterized protein n=1 Tax=candidate division MSBL1 archaeon SCGC-AAA261F17 TaxID=1698274 RepID=A0A133V6W0_9EURY|nr:hypothetical protein AKJ44_01245 [candidate division MSBL1 archaeon SCGC-AAA261F17]
MDWLAVLMPGEFLARRYDPSYLKFAMKAKNRGTIAKIAAIMEYAFVVMVGLISGIFSFYWPILVLLAAYPFVVIGEPWVWRKYYGEIAEGVGVTGAFLANLDMLYLFTIGYLVGVLIL